MASNLAVVDSVVSQLERAARGNREAGQRLTIEGVPPPPFWGAVLSVSVAVFRWSQGPENGTSEQN